MGVCADGMSDTNDPFNKQHEMKPMDPETKKIVNNSPYCTVKIGGGKKGHLKWVVSGGKAVKRPRVGAGFELKLIVTPNGDCFGGNTDDYKVARCSRSVTGKFNRQTGQFDLLMVYYVNCFYATTQRVVGSFEPGWRYWRGTSSVTHVTPKSERARGTKVGDMNHLIGKVKIDIALQYDFLEMQKKALKFQVPVNDWDRKIK